MERLVHIQSALSHVKDSDLDERILIVSEWSSKKVLAFLAEALSDSDTAGLTLIFDILSTLATYDLKQVRVRFSEPDDSMSLLLKCVDALHRSTASDGLMLLESDFFRQLLEPSLGADTFISNAYEAKFLEVLCSPLTSDLTEETQQYPPSLLQIILDILSFCICSHQYIAKGYFLRLGSLFKSLRGILLHEASPEYKAVILAAIRLVRAMLWQKDPQYLKCLSAFNIPSLILQLVHLHRPRGWVDGTMIYSAALEIVTFICVNNQTSVIESLCRPGSESEELVQILSEDLDNKSHSELAQFMLSTMRRISSQLLLSGGAYEDMNSRHSIGSSRGRSVSPHPLVVPMPSRKRAYFDESDGYFNEEDEEETIIPKTPGGSPDELPRQLRRRDSDAEAEIQPPAIPSPDSQMLKRVRRFSTTDNSSNR